MKPLPEQLSDTLKKHSIRPTYQRLLILEYLKNNSCHPTVDQMYRSLQKHTPALTKGTIYNTLNSFMEAGLLRLITIEDNETRYDIATGDHGHFKCESCGIIYDFVISTEDMHFEELKGFKVTDKNVYFKGICEECLSNKNEYEERTI